jgi:hypothetical protein
MVLRRLDEHRSMNKTSESRAAASLKRVALAVAGVAVVGVMFGFAAWCVYKFFEYVSAVPKELGAALVAAAATVLVATLTVVLGRYYERKKERDALYRDKKTEIYDEFLKEFFPVLYGETRDSQADLVAFLREFTRKLILWSGPEVIEAFAAWKDHLAKGKPDAQSIFLTEAFLLAIRKDLRHLNAGIRKGFFARLFLKEGALFLEIAKRNPHVTLEELAEIERRLHAGAARSAEVP